MIRRLINDILQGIAKFLPGSTTTRPFLHKLRGVKFPDGLWVKEEDRVFIGRDVTLDHDFPDRIVLHKGVQIVEGTKIFCHFRGPAEKVIFYDYSRTGPSCVVSAIKGQTLIIGKGAAVGPLSNVSKNIPPMTFCSSTPPAKPIATQAIPLTTNTVYEEWRKGLKKI